MSFRRGAAPWLLLASVSGCAPGARTGILTPTAGDRFFVAGYHPYWAGDAWEAYPWDALDELYYFEIEVGADGRVSDPHGWGEASPPLLERARRSGVQVVPTIAMHDADAFAELFGSPTSTARLVGELVTLLRANPGVTGLHLDFEVFSPVDPGVRDGYTAFVASLRTRMEELNPVPSLSAFSLAFDDDDVFNERALAELTDFLVVQGYDFHHPADDHAGPLAALRGWGRLNWSSVVDRYLSFGVPARKIVMAVPLFGYEWPVTTDDPGAETRGDAVTIPLAAAPDLVPELPRSRSRAARHGLRRDPESGTPFYVFEEASGWYQGWFEDAESLRAKYAFVRERGLGGVALFPLAYGDEPLWADLRSAFSRSRD